MVHATVMLGFINQDILSHKLSHKEKEKTAKDLKS